MVSPNVARACSELVEVAQGWCECTTTVLDSSQISICWYARLRVTLPTHVIHDL